MIDPKDVLFIGQGTTAVCYYRAMLPAMAIGADWCGLVGNPPAHRWVTGIVRKESKMPRLADYKVIIVQQPSGQGWLETIEALRANGVKVIYEVDDYLHGVRHQQDHGFKKHYGKQYLAQAEAAMRACTAITTTTKFIAKGYSNFNEHTFLCPNGIDLRRYDLTVPERTMVNVGWAGATGHRDTVIPWLQALAGVMEMKPNVCFVSIGEPFARGFTQKFGEQRALAIPWSQVEQYPAAMTMFDIALAPGGQGGWWKGKSDLRWLEASALGIPTIANPIVYPEVEDGVTGLLAETAHEAFEKILLLVGEEELRRSIGARAKEYVSENRSIEAMAANWQDAINQVAELD
jgi:glycosyltransferase involved in cell wall biosynthesis